MLIIYKDTEILSSRSIHCPSWLLYCGGGIEDNSFGYLVSRTFSSASQHSSPEAFLAPLRRRMQRVRLFRCLRHVLIDSRLAQSIFFRRYSGKSQWWYSENPSILRYVSAHIIGEVMLPPMLNKTWSELGCSAPSDPQWRFCPLRCDAMMDVAVRKYTRR